MSAADGRLPSAQDLLKQHEHVVYTALAVLHGQLALCWNKHTSRLQESFRVYTGARSEAAGTLSADFIQQQVLPAVKQACSSAQIPGQHLRVVVILHSDSSLPR